MKSIILSLMIVLGVACPQLVFADRVPFRKTGIHKTEMLKRHPIQDLLSGTGSLDRSSRNSNRLLVLLIDFQEDDDPQTTGNGKFLQEPADYPIPFGKPPHDYQFFMNQLQALTYYYEAVSFGSFQVEYDIYPISEPGSFTAYTLPNEMAYYNPPGASQTLMISRFEEYFTDAFMAADQDSSIDFSLYEHFMFIHAGADYQHDINGDTPADIPSFFIKVGTGKEVVVGDGVVIDHACNVPEMITQDIDEDEDGIYTINYNYGVINAVMVHEFGHSIGFVDLYNTYNNTPQVGYYDIMDSGGSGLIGFEYPENSNQVYYIEGIFPALPGAWSRILAFEDDFRARGILKDITEFDLTKSINLLPAEKIYDSAAMNDSTAYFVKVQLNETEYLLIENRQVDPDGDGGASIITTDDLRVILAPSYLNSNTGPNYEYDYLLPGFLDEDYNSYGGGLLIWHIDDAILAENDNFANNTVNTSHSRRAVKIIEADDIDDIGNIYSMYWQGTAYEPFYKYMPIIDSDGFFTGWDNDYILNLDGVLEFIGTIASDELSSTSKPELITNAGASSIYSLYDISSYSIEYNADRSMSFRFGIRPFEVTELIAELTSISYLGKVGQYDNLPLFPIIEGSAFYYYSLIGDNWADNLGIVQSFNLSTEFPVLPFDLDLDGNSEYLYIVNNSICSFNPDGVTPLSFDDVLTDPPLMIDCWLLPTLVVPTQSGIFFYAGMTAEADFLPIQSAKLTFDGSHLIAAAKDKIYRIADINQQPAATQEIDLPNYETIYTPVNYVDSDDPQKNSTFIQTGQGDIYRIRNGVAEEIFRLSAYTSQAASQLALGDFAGISLVFGADDRVFALSLDGTMKAGFPAYLESKNIVPYAYPRIIAFPDETVVLLEEEQNGYLAVNQQAEPVIKYSFFWQQQQNTDQYYWDSTQHKLFYLFADSGKYLYSSYLSDISENPIIWNGYRNSDYSLFLGTDQSVIPVTPHLTAYAYPNPSAKGEIRFKVIDARTDISLQIYDIAGNLIHAQETLWNQSTSQDIRWNTNSIASGIYFAVIKTGGKIKKIPFAIEK